MDICHCRSTQRGIPFLTILQPVSVIYYLWSSVRIFIFGAEVCLSTEPLYLIVLHSIPETGILISLGGLLIGIRPPWQRILLVAALTALASHFIRVLPLPPGINVFLQLPILIGLLAYFCSLPLKYATMVSFLGLVLLGIFETLYVMVVTGLTGITIPQAMSNPIWRALFPLPEFLLLGLIIMILIRYDIVIYNIAEVLEEKKLNREEQQSN